MQEYAKTDQQLHFLSQVIAKVNRTYVPKKEDDSHTNLFFDALSNRITGRWIETGDKKFIFTLNLDTQTIEVLDETRKIAASLATAFKHIDEVEREIEKALQGLGLNPDGFTGKLHFEIPQYNFAKNPIAEIDQNGLAQWKIYRNLANQACFLLMGYAQMWEEIRIWPHHFDTGIYFVPKKNIGIGFGLAMEDDMAGSPYFYLAGYPLKGEIIYKDLSQSDYWEWKTDNNWKGVILTLATLSKYTEEERWNVINQYIIQNLKWYLNYEN